MPNSRKSSPKNSDPKYDRSKGRSSKGKVDKSGNKFPTTAPEGYKPTKGTNDITWHTPDVALLERSANMSWSYQAGELIPMRSLGVDAVNPDYTVYFNQPGIMVIRDQIAFGGVGYTDPTSARNLNSLPTYNAANTLLTEMRSKSRIRNTYDAPDVLMLMCAMANIYAGVTLAKRLAATVRMFTYQNEYFPDQLIRAQGFDPQWFKKNQFRFVTELNVIISEINKIYIPDRMHYFKLINERFSNYFTEGESIKDQVYVITPAFLNIIDYNPDTDFASMVRPLVCLPGTVSYSAGSNYIDGTSYNAGAVYTGDVLLDALRQMVNAVVNHDSTPDITGDMANCFGDGARYMLSFAQPDAVALPVFDEEILETIHNMSWSFCATEEFGGYTNSTGTTRNVPRAFATLQFASDNRMGTWDNYKTSHNTFRANRAHTETMFNIIDVHKDPNPQKAFAVTRLRNYTDWITKIDDLLYAHVVFSTDLICDVQFMYYKMENASKVWYMSRISQGIITSNISLYNFALTCFHYRPMQYLIDSDGKMVDNQWPAGESDIYTQIPSVRDLENMNRISLLTLLGAYNNVG